MGFLVGATVALLFWIAVMVTKIADILENRGGK